MRRWSFLVYGVFCHLLFLAIFLYMVGFVANRWVPKSIDSGPTGGLVAVGIDLLLIVLFAAQHSVMARPCFKHYWTRIVPQPIERSTYVLMSCVVTVVLMWQWQSAGPVLWDVQHPVGRLLLWGCFAAGWLLVPGATLMINHFDLFGTRQVWLHHQNRPYTTTPFHTPLLYRHIRHPLYLGWAIAFWATPTMTLGHFLFAGAMTLYMVIATVFEERDLVEHFGSTYREYQRRVPKFFPRLRGGASSKPEAPIAADPAFPEAAAR